ncbi:MAG: hypothetical protein AUJ52_00400 [Elusimicrobia bacterium CG1_02_63_36]|nr:MAG: hypothetical protein AUJ52_00400 [Elusimicrobia bacterium CG1_02_63_36]PIP84593.1 MAG: DUF58 domain-containing protein [Elusimicrobia bacterium CG22_combo_CG10-13_8_21_14_all_63_91]PJA17723.1 MAG: DUF58 domain-containing protein [Elusimicrobia bacterium CG_4_10_14_0_2_um_filter_63_34]PJB25900.1 MAG: DUF58 domain-containing protein [Elusimicrobia bacterium CG_4_9_14_3_um_filter_62_55]
MLTAELLAQVRRIEIKTGRLVNETFAGKYLSAFKGRGMEFAQVREYVPGDDIRTIDWNVTARSGKPFVREYQEERELTLVVACDLSGSQFFGSAKRFKREAAAELSAVLSFAALKNNDKVGSLLFTDGVERFIPPRKGHKHALAIVRDLLAFEPERRGTDIGASLDTLNRLLHRRSIVVLVSDFQCEGFERAFRNTAKKHDLIPVLIEDPRETRIPALGAYLELEDPETGTSVLFEASSNAARAEAAERRRAGRDKLKALFTSAGVEPIEVRTDEPIVDPVIRFFRRRARRFR